MKIDMHPSLYLKYKDKRIKFYGTHGTIVGYLMTNLKSLTLVLETNTENEAESIIDFTDINNFVLKDYHGDIRNQFYFINKRDFDEGFAAEINI